MLQGNISYFEVATAYKTRRVACRDTTEYSKHRRSEEHSAGGLNSTIAC